MCACVSCVYICVSCNLLEYVRVLCTYMLVCVGSMCLLWVVRWWKCCTSAWVKKHCTWYYRLVNNIKHLSFASRWERERKCVICSLRFEWFLYIDAHIRSFSMERCVGWANYAVGEFFLSLFAFFFVRSSTNLEFWHDRKVVKVKFVTIIITCVRMCCVMLCCRIDIFFSVWYLFFDLISFFDSFLS